MSEYKNIIQKIKPEMQERVDYLKSELSRIRADRATPSLVENIMIVSFGQNIPLKQLAAISCPGQRQIVIQPWDKSYIKDILNALQKAESEFSPLPENDLIRINLPPLTEEYRNKLLKNLSEKRENARVELKRVREKALKEIQDKAKNGEITEDDKFRAKDELQKVLDDYNKEVDEAVESREKDIKGV